MRLRIGPLEKLIKKLFVFSGKKAYLTQMNHGGIPNMFFEIKVPADPTKHDLKHKN